jgi:hypothetical protein
MTQLVSAYVLLTQKSYERSVLFRWLNDSIVKQLSLLGDL